MYRTHIIVLLVLTLYSCKTDKEIKYLRYVGDIMQDSLIDNENFKLCNGDNNVLQYFNTSQGFQYDGGKIKILKDFQKNFNPSIRDNQNGLIRIRFIVNCDGETGRFRILESDFEYQEFTFDKNIINQLVSITENLKGWKILKRKNQNLDYYQYLIFKIENGNIKEILP